jgi:hypothetical protein
MADRSRLSFTSSSGSSEDEEVKMERMVMNVNEETGRWQIADPEVRAAQERKNERIRRRVEAEIRSEEAAREADAKVQYGEKVRRQLERDPLRDPEPKSLEDSIWHQHIHYMFRNGSSVMAQILHLVENEQEEDDSASEKENEQVDLENEQDENGGD